MLLKIYSDHVKIYHQDQFLCERINVGVQAGAYSTDTKHLPENSHNYGDWNSSRYLNWARRIGPNVHTVVERLFPTRA